MGGEFAALVVGCTLIRAMHLMLCACDLVHEGLLIDDILLMQRAPTRLGDRPCLYDGRHVSVFVVGGAGTQRRQGLTRSTAARCDLVET